MWHFPKVSVAREREFERENVRGKRSDYLANNPLERYEADLAYREKVDQLRSGLEKLGVSIGSRWILDLGGNTGGEATVLIQEGYRILLSDINELALEIARERAQKFKLNPPWCVGADVHSLPFADQSFQAVMVIEALHHFDDYDQALSEIYRSLEPGGGLMALEPNGWNPIRRLSEIRDRFRGTIEKSFTAKQLQKLLRRAGFEAIEIQSVPSGRSALRMDDVPGYRRWLARFHAYLQRSFPRFFGAYQIWARKPGQASSSCSAWPDFLTVPGGGESVQFVEGRWQGDSGFYPDRNGVPVLIQDDFEAE